MYIYIGKIVNTHGIKGEVRIISDINYKKDVFKINNNVYIGKNKIKETINSYRVHKNFDMITFTNINDINDVLKYKGENIYIKKDEIKITGYFDEELIGLDVITDHIIGKVKEIQKGFQKIIVVEGKKEYLIPYVDAFIKKIDINDKKIYINEIEGLINEN